jgi:hypothetical protein
MAMPLLHVLWVNGCDAAITLEVPDVIRENAIDSMNRHRGNKPGVVNLDSFYRVASQAALGFFGPGDLA